MHCDAVRGTFQRNEGRGLRARQEPADLHECLTWGVQHDVLAFAHLLDSIDALQEPLHPLLLLARQFPRRADEHTVALEYRLDFPEVIGLQRRARRDEIADEVGSPQPWRALYRHGELHDPGTAPPITQILLENIRIGRGDPCAFERREA